MNTTALVYPSLKSFSDLAAETITASHDGATAVVAFRHSAMAGDASYNPALAALRARLADLAAHISPLSKTLLPAGVFDAARAAAVRIVAPAFNEAVSAVQSAKRDHAKRLAIMADSPVGVMEAEDRARFLAMDLGQRADFIQNGDVTMLAAIVRAGHHRFPDVPENLWSALTGRASILAHIARSGMAGNFPNKPSASDPAATGVDQAALEAAATAMFAEVRAEADDIEDAEQILRNTIAVVSVTSGLSIEGGYDLLAGGDR